MPDCSSRASAIDLTTNAGPGSRRAASPPGAPAPAARGRGPGRVATRLVTVLVTLAVPEKADAGRRGVVRGRRCLYRAGGVSAAGVEGHLPVPGSVVQHRRGRQPWRVETVTGDGAMLCNLAGDWSRIPLPALEPDQVERSLSSTGQGD